MSSSRSRAGAHLPVFRNESGGSGVESALHDERRILDGEPRIPMTDGPIASHMQPAMRRSPERSMMTRSLAQSDTCIEGMKTWWERSLPVPGPGEHREDAGSAKTQLGHGRPHHDEEQRWT